MQNRLSLLWVVLLLLASALPAAAQDSDHAATIEWLKSRVQADGGFNDGFSEESGIGPTTEAIYAAAAAGEDITTWGNEQSPLDYLTANRGTLTTTGSISKVIIALKAMGQDPTNVGGENLVEELLAQYDSDTGLFKGVLTEHGYAITALKAVGEEIPQGAAPALVGYQGDDGGWSFDGESQSDTNTTALAIQALIAAGHAADSEPVSRALGYLESQQNEDGGFPYQAPSDFGTESDANSTAWAIQGLLAAGESLEDWNNPDNYVASLLEADGGYQWKSEIEGSNFLATAQVLPALEGALLYAMPVVAPSSGAAAAPAVMPASGGVLPWGEVVLAGVLSLVSAAALRRRVSC